MKSGRVNHTLGIAPSRHEKLTQSCHGSLTVRRVGSGVAMAVSRARSRFFVLPLHMSMRCVRGRASVDKTTQRRRSGRLKRHISNAVHRQLLAEPTAPPADRAREDNWKRLQASAAGLSFLQPALRPLDRSGEVIPAQRASRASQGGFETDAVARCRDLLTHNPRVARHPSHQQLHPARLHRWQGAATAKRCRAIHAHPSNPSDLRRCPTNAPIPPSYAASAWIRPMVLLPALVNHSAPSGPAVMSEGKLIVGSEKLVTPPDVVILPIDPVNSFTNHSAPSDPAAMLVGPLMLGAVNVEMTPAGVILPMDVPPIPP